jgi:flagellar M-ring protein FliF
MNDFFKKYLDRITSVWKKWTLVQRIIFAAVIAAGLGGFGFLAAYSSSPSMVPLLHRAVPNEGEMSRISQRLEQENVPYQITADSRILVHDEKTAQRLRAILARENLIPAGTDPWQIFDVERWTITDFERNINLRRAITRELEAHIGALEDVDAVSAILGVPEDSMFAEDQKPLTASIRLTPKPGSDLTENRKKLEGIERLVRYAVPGLKPENITITDNQGITLNDFDSMKGMDELNLTERKLKAIREYEERFTRSISSALKGIFTESRISIFKLNVDVDTSKKTVDDLRHYPIVMTPDNPKTPYDESAEEGAKVPSIRESTQIIDENFRGTGLHPYGPPGQEGQTPPAYKDLENMVGEYRNSRVIENNVINKTNTHEERTPWEVKRVTVSVAIDGLWKWKYNEKGEVVQTTSGGIEREYIPVGDEELSKAINLVRSAVGYSQDRGDSVTVEHLAFDRTAQHNEEDSDFLSRQQRQRIILVIVIALGGLLILFILFRFISREIERRRQMREEELARQQQLMRERALMEAEQEGQEVEMSVEERTRMEMLESAVNLAREHPEDVAKLIRTWLMEE